MKNSPVHIPSLTPMRGIAALLVVVFHFSEIITPLAPPEIFLVKKFYLMVDLFFVLSGFIMYHVYGSWFSERIAGKEYLRYMWARVSRLYPLHLFIILLLVGLFVSAKMVVEWAEFPGPMGKILNPWGIPTSLLLIQAWGMHIVSPWNLPAWSISVEWFLYFLFPFLMLLLSRKRVLSLALMTLVSFAGLVWVSVFMFPALKPIFDAEMGLPADFIRPAVNLDLTTGPGALLRGLCGFMLGMVVYELHSRGWKKDHLGHPLWFIGTWALLFGLWFKDLLPDYLAVPLFAFLVLVTSHLSGSFQKVLNGRFFTFLGNISYSLYLVHTAILSVAFLIAIIAMGEVPGPPPESGGPEDINYLINWVGALIYILLSVGLATLTYRFIELPMRRRLKHVFFPKSTPDGTHQTL